MKDNYTTLHTLLGAYNQHIEHSHICLVDTMPSENVATPVVIICLDQNKNIILSSKEVIFDTVLSLSSLSSGIPEEVNIGISKTDAYIMRVRSEFSEGTVSWFLGDSNNKLKLTQNTIQIMEGTPSGDEIGCLPGIRFLIEKDDFTVVKV